MSDRVEAVLARIQDELSDAEKSELADALQELVWSKRRRAADAQHGSGPARAIDENVIIESVMQHRYDDRDIG